MYFFIRIQNTRIFTVKQQCRYIFTNNIKYDIKREKKFLEKMIQRNALKRNSLEEINTSYINRNTQISKYTKRRMTVLNKIFMKHITNLISTAEVEPEILNKNIDISHVQITADFKFVNIFWINHETETSDIEELLKKCAFELRHKLCQLNIMGNIPYIQFIKNKTFSNMQEVEQKLKSIQFDENYAPNLYPFATYHTVSGPKTSDINEENNFSVNVPIMQHNIFGLNHFEIMSKVKDSINKSKNAVFKLTVDKLPNSDCTTTLETNLLTDKEYQKQFIKFLNQRRKEQKMKNKKKYSKENNYIYDLNENADVNQLENDESSSDYIDEDEYKYDDYSVEEFVINWK